MRRWPALALALVASGCVEYRVVRDFGEGPVVGRYISPEAYALYGRGRDAEAGRRLEEARAFYARAAKADPTSPGIPTREGSVLCAMGRVEDAERAFARAEALGAAFAPLWEERARCALARGRGEAALASALRGIGLEPSSLALSRLAAEALTALGRGREATELLLAYAILNPTSEEARALVGKAAAASGPAALARPLGPKPTTTDDVDEAWRAGDVAAAKRAGLRAGLSTSEVALRGALAGKFAAALALAELLRAADPDDATARVAAALALEGLGKLPEAAKALEGAAPSEPPSALARAALADLLRRRVGDDAAAAAR